MLATPRRLLLALVALAACTPELFGGVICTPNGNGSWTCSGDGSGYDPGYPYQPGQVVTNTVYVPTVQTNILGVCTNCVAMSPSECESIKKGINDQVRDIKSEVDKSVDNIRSVKSVKTDIEDRINAFRDDYMSAMHWYEMEWLEEGYDDELYYPVQGSLDDLDYYADAVETSLVSLGASADSIGSFANSINCTTCTASWGGDTPSGGGGGGGGSGSGSGSSSCPDCPCKEQMEALKSVLQNDILPKVKSLDDNVKAFKTKLLDTQKYLDALKYVKIGFATNSVPVETELSADSGDWFDMVLASLKRNNDINASTTYLLKRIMDNLNKDKVEEDLDSIQNSVDDIKGRLESLSAEFDSKFGKDKFKFADVEDNFAFDDSVFGAFPNSKNLPSTLTIYMPQISLFNHHFDLGGSVVISTQHLVPFLDLCRSVFRCFYWCCLAFFIIIFFRLFYAFLIRFVKLLANVLQW